VARTDDPEFSIQIGRIGFPPTYDTIREPPCLEAKLLEATRHLKFR